MLQGPAAGVISAKSSIFVLLHLLSSSSRAPSTDQLHLSLPSVHVSGENTNKQFFSANAIRSRDHAEM